MDVQRFRKFLLFLSSYLIISLILSSCGPGQIFGPTLTPTNTATPSVTPSPTKTPTPTITPSPTPVPSVPGVLYVSPTAVGGDCTSWLKACTLKKALVKSRSGNEIWVMVGVYKPANDADRSASFALKSGVAIYGGFNGTEFKREQRDWQANATILSGDIDDNDTNTDGNYIAETAVDIKGDNSWNVVIGNGTNATAVLDGFIITAAQYGGMSNLSGSPTLINLVFSGNTNPVGDGGGMKNISSNPTLTNILFSGNTALSGGGISNVDKSNLTLMDVTFNSNTASWYSGGGLHNLDSNLKLFNVAFNENTAAVYGGGIYNDLSENSTLTNVTFSNNDADHGGGMASFESNMTLANVTFRGNAAKYFGGGMYNSDQATATLTNIAFSSNTAGACGGGMINYSSNVTLINTSFKRNDAGLRSGCDGGGGIYNLGSNTTLINATLNGNTAKGGGGGIANEAGSRAILTNVILWGNSASVDSEIFNSRNKSTSLIAYSDIQGCGGSKAWDRTCGQDKGQNIDTDPLFVNVIIGDLHLRITSPAIDAGTNDAVPSDIAADLDGYLRFVNIPSVTDMGNGISPIVDMGAYEAMDPSTPQATTTSLSAMYPPIPTFTPMPPTPTPIPIPLENIFPGIRIVTSDSFDDPNDTHWEIDSNVAKIEGGLLTIVGKNWSGGSYDWPLREGYGVVINFQFSPPSSFSMYINHGEWQTDSYRHYGVVVTKGDKNKVEPFPDLYQGSNSIGEGALPPGTLDLQPNTWYSLLLKIEKDGKFYTRIWNPLDSQRMTEYSKTFTADWFNLSWIFHVEGNKGTILFDDFKIVKFEN